MKDIKSISELIRFLMTLIYIGTGLRIAYSLIRMILAGEDRANYYGRIRNALIFLVISMCAHGLITYFYNGFTHPERLPRGEEAYGFEAILHTQCADAGRPHSGSGCS